MSDLFVYAFFESVAIIPGIMWMSWICLFFTKLIEIAVNGRQLVRAFSYIVENAESDQTAFIEMLQNNG